MSTRYSVILRLAQRAEGSRRFTLSVAMGLGNVRAVDVMDVRALAMRDPSPSSRLRMTRIGGVGRRKRG
jgi:hypothetical protein